LFLLASGCATQPEPPAGTSPRPAASLPANAMLSQRALLTARGRQFALNGYLALSERGGKRLVVTESFGSVMADLLVKPDGKVFVMKSSRMFPAKWVRRCMAPDLECLFGTTPAANCRVTTLDTNHFLLERRGYSLDVRIVETKPGPQPAELFDETRAQEP
jgi:hypothetical protein